MTIRRITDLPARSTLDGEELLELAQLSTTVRIAATTISAQASDNSFNDSADGFVAAGFVAGDRVAVVGFTSTANNLVVGTLTGVTASKLTIAGTDGDAIVDEAAGDSVVIAKWTSRRATAQDIADLAAGGGGSVAVDDEGSEIVASASRINFVGSGVTVTDGGGGEAIVTIPGGGGGGGGGGGLELIAEFTATGGETSVDFTGIPATYKGLRILTYARGNAAAGDTAFQVQFNGDTGSNYFYRQTFHPFGGASADNQSSASTVQFGCANAPTNQFDAGIIEIPFYAETVGRKTLIFQSFNTEGSSQYRTIFGGALWKSTSAIDEVKLLVGFGGLVAGSKVAIYGYN